MICSLDLSDKWQIKQQKSIHILSDVHIFYGMGALKSKEVKP